jgi:hypothetical protein
MAAMFVNGLGQNEHSLERTSHRCFLPSFTSFDWGVSEEKIKMWKVNGRQTTTTDDRRRTKDAKWWQKLALPLTRWAKSFFEQSTFFHIGERNEFFQKLQILRFRGSFFIFIFLYLSNSIYKLIFTYSKFVISLRNSKCVCDK